MLRITIHDYPGAVVLQLDGRIAVPWPMRYRAGQAGRPITGDMLPETDTSAWSVAEAGKRLDKTLSRDTGRPGAGFCGLEIMVQAAEIHPLECLWSIGTVECLSSAIRDTCAICSLIRRGVQGLQDGRKCMGARPLHTRPDGDHEPA